MGDIIIKYKYLDDDSLHHLICHEFPIPSSYSTIWGSFKKILGHVADKIVWLFRDGIRIPLGVTSIQGLNKSMVPSPRLIHKLAHRGIVFLSQTIHTWSFNAPLLKNSIQLGLMDEDASKWELIYNELRAAGFSNATGGDSITWNGPTKEEVPIVKDIYSYINSQSNADQYTCVFGHFWS